jgi:hypothetical protein
MKCVQRGNESGKESNCQVCNERDLINGEEKNQKSAAEVEPETTNVQDCEVMSEDVSSEEKGGGQPKADTPTNKGNVEPENGTLEVDINHIDHVFNGKDEPENNKAKSSINGSEMSNEKKSELDDGNVGCKKNEADRALDDLKIESDITGAIYYAPKGGIKNFGDSHYYMLGPSFSDPTVPLSDKMYPLYTFKSSTEIETNIDQLIENSVGLLVCLNDDVLRSMAFTMIKSSRFKGYEKRILPIDGANAERTDLYLDMFVYQKIGKGQDMIVIVEIDKQRGFFDSLFEKKFHTHSYQGSLRDKKILLLCMVNSQLIEKVPKNNQANFIFHRWDIDFLSFLLELSFPERTDIALIKKEIEIQRKYGLWDVIMDENTFHQLVSNFISQGKEVFEAELNKRREFMASGRSPNEFMDSLNKVEINKLFADKEPHKTVLYTAAYYSKLTPRDFEQIVLLLLRGKKIHVESESQITTENGEVKKIQHKKEKDLIDVWKEDADKILKECYLKAFNADDASQYIDFTSPYLRDEIRKYVEEEYPFYLRHQFEPIQDSALAILPDISPRISENVIRLSVEMALRNPVYYGAEWLVNFIVKLNNYFEVNNTLTDSIFEEIIKFIVNHQNRKMRAKFYARLSNLIREMLNHSQLKDVIDSFLNRLLEISHHEAVLEIVLQIGKRLRFAPHFDLLYWLKRLLDQGNMEIQSNTYKSLLGLALNSKFQLFELLDSVKSWLPEKEKDKNRYSPSNKYALLFILDYCQKATENLSFEKYGEWPSTYPLFAPYQEEDSFDKRLKAIVDWLLHPGIQAVLDSDEFQEGNYSALYSLAFVFEQWSSLLLGCDKNKYHSRSIEIFDILVAHLAKETDQKQKSEITNYWRIRSSSCSTEINQLSFRKTEERKKLMCKYNTLTRLISSFREHTSVPKKSLGGKQ